MEYAFKNNNQYESIEFTKSIIQTIGKSQITLLGKLYNNEFAIIKNISKNNTITDADKYITYKLISKYPFSYSISGVMPKKYYNKQKIEDFLYEITYGNIDYEYAKQNIDNTLESYGGCSSIRNCNFFGRNFDWLYNNDVQLIVHTPDSLDHYGVLGIAGAIKGLDKDSILQDNPTKDDVDLLKIAPFCLLDGINSQGLFCTHNIVPLDEQETSEIHAKIEERERISISMLIRYILDKFKTAIEAINYLKNYVTIYFPETMISDWKHQSHFLIGDLTRTYTIEFINGEMVVGCQKYITNFQLTNVKLDKNNYLIKPYILNGVNPYGSGLERYKLITDNYKITNTLEGMDYVLDLVKYSNCYTYDESAFWYSEITGMVDDSLVDKITVDTDPEICSTSYGEVMDNWDNKDRDDPKVWITCHSSIYDIRNKILYVKNQENETRYIFSI